MTRKLIIAILAVVFSILGFIYVKLGGLNEPTLEVADSPGYFITGRFYKGSYNDEAVENIFYEVRQLLKEGRLHGILTIVYYKDPMEAEGQVENFIGIATPEKTTMVPPGLEQRKIPPGKFLRATIEAHTAVMPVPGTIKEKLAALANDQGLEMGDISIEKYYSDYKLVVEVPVN